MDARRELQHIYRHADRLLDHIGESVVWYEYDPDASTIDDVYDSGPARVYKTPFRVPVLFIDQQEWQERMTPEGKKPVQSAHFSLTMKQATEAGISRPSESPPHLNDFVFYDGRYYEIIDYQIRARSLGDVVIGVQCIETFPHEERVFDPIP
jgi:hypothetical protein